MLFQSERQMTSTSKRIKWKSIIAVIAFVVAAVAFYVFTPKNDSKPANIVVSKKDTIPEGTVVMNKPLISEDPTNREELKKRKDSIWWKTERGGERDKGYAKERERFAKVLQQASDEELLVVLKYAIANRYVPNRDIDPYSSMFVLVGYWQRSLKVYDKLSGRKDLLRKIYPDVKMLDDYIRWNGHGRPYPDDVVSQTILDNVGKQRHELDSIVGAIFDKSSLAYKYFGTPNLN